MPAAKPVPSGFRAVTPHIICRGAAQAIEWYKQAFGAEEIRRSPGNDGRLMHAEIRIGDSIVMLVDEYLEWGTKSPQTLAGTPVCLHLYVEDADAWYQRAVQAGATATMPLMDAFWGDRYGQLRDPFGHLWSVATHKEDLSPDEIKKRAEAVFAGTDAGQDPGKG